VYFDAKEKDKAEGKHETYSVVFRKLTGKDVVFGYMTKYAFSISKVVIHFYFVIVLYFSPVLQQFL
jgi:hypothetical protein